MSGEQFDAPNRKEQSVSHSQEPRSASSMAIRPTSAVRVTQLQAVAASQVAAAP